MADVFEKLAQQAEKLVAKDAEVAFDYKDAKGNKEARSYVYEARRLKGEVESKRQEKTRSLLDRKRAIDARAKALMEPVQAVIDRHAVEIKRVEDAEKARQEAIEDDLEALRGLGVTMGPDGNLLPSDDMKRRLEQLRGQNITEDRFAEALEEAENLVALGIATLQQHIPIAEAHEEVPPLKRVRDDLDSKGVPEDRDLGSVLDMVVDDLTEVWDNALSDSEDGAFNTLPFIINVARRLIAGEAPSIQIVAEEATA